MHLPDLFVRLLQIVNIKKTLKSQGQQQQQQGLDTDEAMSTDSREALAGSEKGKKPVKSKPNIGRAAGGKFWQK